MPHPDSVEHSGTDTLDAALALARRILNGTADATDARILAELVISLNGWLSSGTVALPAPWRERACARR